MMTMYNEWIHINKKPFTLRKIKSDDKVWRKVKPWLQTYTFLFLEAIAIFFIVSMLIFIILNEVYDLKGQSDFRVVEGGQNALTDEEFLLVEKEFALVGNYWDRYLYFLQHFWDGSMLSYRFTRGADVSTVVETPFLRSFKLGILALIIGVSLGTVVGLMAGRKPGGLFDKLVSSYVIIVLSLPVFVTGLLLQYLSFSTDNFNIVYNDDNVATWILPIFNIAIPTIAVYARFLKTTVGEELPANYVNLAKTKGVSSIGIAFKHVLKPSLYPLVTNLPAAVIFSFSGAIVTESIYGIDGSGTVFLQSIDQVDTWLLLYISMIYTLLSLVAFVVRDLSYPLIDPQAQVDVGLLKRRRQ